MYVDPQSSIVSDMLADDWNTANKDKPAKTGQVIEYEEIEKLFRTTFPDEKIFFNRGITPHRLQNVNPDFYVWDIGGMCSVDLTGTRRTNFCRELLHQIKDHPNTYFVPWSVFTHNYIRNALTDLFDQDDLDPKNIPENLIILDEESRNEGLDRVPMEKLSELYRNRKPA